MYKEEYFAVDRLIISEEIKKMSKEELDREIARLEEEARKERELLGKRKEQKAV